MVIASVLVVLPLCLAFAACMDLLTMTIPNRVSIILIGAFFVTAPFVGLGVNEIALSVAAAALVFAACFCLFALNIMGGGDAKLLTASAVWFGFNESLPLFLLSVSVFGGMLTLAVLFLRRQEDLVIASRIPVPRLLLTAKKVPYGVAIALGGLSTYPSSPLMKVALTHLS